MDSNNKKNSIEELKKLIDSIDSIDENNDGIIQKEEMKNALINNPDIDDQMKDLSNEALEKIFGESMLQKDVLKEMVEKDIDLNETLGSYHNVLENKIKSQSDKKMEDLINDVDTIIDNDYEIDEDIIKGIVIPNNDVKNIFDVPEKLNNLNEEKDYLKDFKEFMPDSGIILSSATPNGNVPIGSFLLNKFVNRDGIEVNSVSGNMADILVEFEEIELSSDETVKTKENGRKIYMPLSMFIKLFMNKRIAECDGVKNAHKLTDIMGACDEKAMLLLQQAVSILMKSGKDPLRISEFVSMSLDDTGAFCETGGEKKANIDYSIMPFTYGLRKRLYKQRDNDYVMETKPRDSFDLTYKYKLESLNAQESLDREENLFPDKELGPEIYPSPDKDFGMKHTM